MRRALKLSLPVPQLLNVANLSQLPRRRQLVFYAAVELIGLSVLLVPLVLLPWLGAVLDRVEQAAVVLALGAYWLAAVIGVRLYLQPSDT